MGASGLVKLAASAIAAGGLLASMACGASELTLPDPVNVNLADLIANRDFYDGKYVRTCGYIEFVRYETYISLVFPFSDSTTYNVNKLHVTPHKKSGWAMAIWENGDMSSDSGEVNPDFFCLTGLVYQWDGDVFISY